MKLMIFVAFLLMFLPFFCFSQSPEELFNKGNEYYSKGDFVNAIKNYKKIIDTGYESAPLFMNLGNAYFKLKKLPESILYFERAKRLAPDDDDIDFNLKIANLRTVDRFDVVPKFFLSQWFENTRNYFTANGWSKVVIVLSWVTFLSLGGFILFWQPFAKKLTFGLAVIGFCLAVFSVMFAYQQYNAEQTRDKAIIFSQSVYVKSSPDEKGTDLFILHEGTKVDILDSVGKWLKIKIPNGNLGWIPGEELQVI